jgi:hypothetical protein
MASATTAPRRRVIQNRQHGETSWSRVRRHLRFRLAWPSAKDATKVRKWMARRGIVIGKGPSYTKYVPTTYIDGETMLRGEMACPGLLDANPKIFEAIAAARALFRAEQKTRPVVQRKKVQAPLKEMRAQVDTRHPLDRARAFACKVPLQEDRWFE